MSECAMDSSGSGYVPITGSCEHGDEPLCYDHLIKNSASLNFFFALFLLLLLEIIIIIISHSLFTGFSWYFSS
jgi:hypothetical protein